ncbi:MAG: type II secretion system F family protein [Armatimonadota bacterium]
MAHYFFKAVDENGGVKEGYVEAIDEFEALKVLKEKKLQVLNLQRKSFFFSKKPDDKDDTFLGESIREKKEKKKKIIRSVSERKIKIIKTLHYDEFVIFLREFATLIKSGISILAAIEILADHSTDTVLRKALSQVSRNLYDGMPLYSAFSKDVKIFPQVFISMLQAGVISGNLPKILNDLADYYEKEQKVRKKFMAALTYPILVLIVSVAGIFFLVNYIFPNFISMFKSMNVKLPTSTKILIFIVNLFNQPVSLMIITVSAVLLAFIIWSYLKTPFGSYQFDWFKIKLPIVGNIIKKMMLCRFSRTLGTLYENGINLSYALDITCEVIDNKYYREEIKKAKDEILNTGEHMHKVMERNSENFPTSFSHFVAVGEETGQLGNMMKKIAHYFEVEIFYLFDNFITILEPVIIVILGGFVLFIMVSLFLPIYNIIGQVGF